MWDGGQKIKANGVDVRRQTHRVQAHRGAGDLLVMSSGQKGFRYDQPVRCVGNRRNVNCYDCGAE